VIAIILLLMLALVSTAGIKYDVLEQQYSALSEYDQDNENNYREEVQLILQDYEKRIKTLESKIE